MCNAFNQKVAGLATPWTNFGICSRPPKCPGGRWGEGRYCQGLGRGRTSLYLHEVQQKFSNLRLSCFMQVREKVVLYVPCKE